MIQSQIKNILNHTTTRSDTMPPSGLLLTVIVQEDPTGIVETADSFVIDAMVEEFNLTIKGINAGRDDLSTDWWFSNIIIICF